MNLILKTHLPKNNDTGHIYALSTCRISTFHALGHLILCDIGPLCPFTNEEPEAPETLSNMPKATPLKDSGP